MHVVAYEDTPTKVVDRKDGRVVVRNYLGTVMEIGVGPQAFLAEMGTDARIGSHFHDIDQFQVFVRGKGKIGKDAWEPGTFHYADAFTPYGPIVPESGSDCVFFTLRHATSSGYYGMPESRAMVPAKRGRNLVARLPLDEFQVAGEGRCAELMALPEDGVKGEGIQLPPGAPMHDHGGDAGGQYCIVMAGALEHAGRRLSPLSLIFADAGESLQDVVAGPEGATVLRLRFPRATSRIGSDPQQLAQRDMGQYAVPEGYQ